MSSGEAARSGAKTGDTKAGEEKGHVAFIAVILAAACLLGLVLLPRLGRSGGRMAGQPAPAFTLPVAHNGDAGARMSLDDLRGKPVLIDFWASWCGPCAMQAPILDRIAKRYDDQGLVVLGVNVDDEARVARAYAAKKGLTYPILLDESGAVQRSYGVDKLPSLVLVDREGQVVSFTQGLIDESSLDAIVRDAL